MEKEVFLSVIIPAYNEEHRLGKTLEAVDAYLKQQPFTYEILAVNDGSTDRTAEVVREYARTMQGLSLVDIAQNRGKGYVTQQGMLKAQGKFRLFMDADNATSIEHFEKMVPYFTEGFDIVIGSRRTKGANIAVHQPFYKEFLGLLGNVYIQVLAVWGVFDTQCGFKAFTSRAAQDIFSRLTIFRWGFDVEVLALGRKLNYKIKEIPVYWVNDPESRVTLKVYFQVLSETTKIRWNFMTNKYKLK